MKRLFIDDERFAPNDGGEWYIARNAEEAMTLIDTYGLPEFISFDHDLGENEPTGMDIAKAIVEGLLDDIYEIPENFDFYVHSQNPVGRDNIANYLGMYLFHHKLNKSSQERV